MIADRLAPELARIRPGSAGLAMGAWDGQETFTWATGELPADHGTLFEIGSITKVFTSTLLVDMAREGLVALDDPLQEHLPEGLGWVILPGAAGISFELLMHDGGTAGFRSFALVSPERRLAVVVLANRVRALRAIAVRALRAMA